MTLNIGIELEYPVSRGKSKYLKGKALKSNNLLEDIRGSDYYSPTEARVTSDPTVGLELVSDVLQLGDGASWLATNIARIQEHFPEHVYEPTGLHSRGTAGLHTHISDIDRSTARDLYDLSQNPYVQLLVCSSVIDTDAPEYGLFRGNYCNFEWGTSSRYNCVNHRIGGHYEWRLPEPQLPDQYAHIERFLGILVRSGYDEALAYAKEKVRAGDTTALIRAKEIGEKPLVDEPEEPTPAITHNRASGHVETASWFDRVRGSNSAPFINYVTIDDEPFYLFNSSSYDSDNPQVVEGVELYDGLVLDAVTLEPVDYPERVRSALDGYRNRQNNEKPERIESAKGARKIMSEVL